jgi:signal transduction histidine kinase
MAADVHDLIMQELSFALTNARALLADPKLAPQASVVVAAAERALSAARDVVNNLAERDREPVVEVVEASVRAAARRAQLTFDAARVPPDARPDRPTCDALIHISREAVTNAIKHANPEAIEVVLEYGDEWRLQVHDEGSGFDASHVVPGFGLESMRERAQALGGSLQITSAAGRGTTVEAVLP